MKITTLDVGFPALTRIFTEMEKLGLSKNCVNISKPPDDADICIIGAWWDYASLTATVLKKDRGKRVWCLWTSPILQSELSVKEVEYYGQIKGLLDDGTIEYVLCGAKDAMEVFGDKAKFIEYPLSLRPIPDVAVKHQHAGLFGPVHYRKNLLHQILALKGMGYVLHTGRLTPEYRSFARACNVHVEEHDWLPEEEYYKLVASMDLGLMCSIPGVESFGYAAFDFLQMDRPVFGSMPWLGDGWAGFFSSDIRWLIKNKHHQRLKGFMRERAENLVKEHNEQFTDVIKSLV